jgi:hypothetical protein
MKGIGYSVVHQGHIPLPDPVNKEQMEEQQKAMQEFTEKVKELCSLQDQAAKARADQRPVNKSINELKKDVTEFMIERKIGQCNYHTDLLYTETKTQPGSLTRPRLKLALVNFFSSGAEAERCYEHIMKELGDSEKTTLKREPKEKILKRKRALEKKQEKAALEEMKRQRREAAESQYEGPGENEYSDDEESDSDDE